MSATEAEVQRRLASLTPEQRRLLELRLRQKEAADPGRPRALPRRDGEELPLSFGQERLWFLDRLDPGSAAYNIPVHLRLAGDLDVAALAATLDEMIRRHEALRTTFAESAVGPVQVVGPRLALSLPVVDLRGLALDPREREAAAWSAAEAARPFDLARGPLLRMLLLRLSDREWSAAFSFHHIVGDGWSIEVLIREIAALYPAFSAGRPSPLPPLPLQYADFAAWQRRFLAGPVLAAQLDYWRRQLGGAPAVSRLPTDRPRPAVQRFHGGSVRHALPEEAVAALRRLCQGQGATLFMGLLAAFSGLLCRVSGAEDLTVGTPVAGRNRGELEGLIGLFINSLVMRLPLDGDPDFVELLARARTAALGAYAHQDLPFAKLVAELSPERNLSLTPLFQVQLVLVEADYAELELPGLTLIPVALEESTSKLDLTLRAYARPRGMELVWLYNSDLFDAATVRRLGDGFATLLGAWTANPGAALSALPLLDAGGEHQLLAEWNDTAVAAWLAPEPGTLHGHIALQAARTPDRIAVAFEGEALTYAGLLAAARQLARRLQGLGVGPDATVGVFAERSLEMVVGLLAILEAGGAYLPLDPAYPADRLAYMMADAAAPVILIQERLRGRLPAHGAAITIISLDGTAAADAGPEPPLATGAAADNLAYVIYTSGSTGRPKGTMNSHRGIVNRLLWMQARYGLTPDDRVLQKTPFSFDVSVWEFFWSLMTGARLVMAIPGGHQDPAYLASAIAAEGITTLHFVPSLLRVFVEAPGVEACTTLRQVMASGEALPLDLVRRFHERLAAELHNLYGPTEAAVDVTWWACEREDGRGTVPIGRPVANTRILILGRDGRPAPLGVPGELHIGGIQLARGYLGRADLTAERFVPDPLAGIWGEPGGRLYRTGDLARTLADGAVEFLGRIDHQVKLRGLRIELGEIEAALGELPGVKAAVVMARGDGGGETRLVAYVVAEPAPELAGIRETLGRSLPEYMLPAALVVLPAMPLTPSGKVDRKALPAPEVQRAAAAEAVAPRTPLETWLAGLFGEILKTGIAGVHDDFFALGGTSISGAVLINRLQRELGEIVHVVVIFDHPTVARLASYLAAQHAGAVAKLLGIEAGGEADEASGERVDEAMLARFRTLIHEPAPLPESLASAPRNPPAVFVLAPPRSGSTLLRVMLGGHPDLFAPPELELLEFDSLAERRDAFTGRDAFRLEGAIRAVMEARGCGPEAAREVVVELEEAGTATRGFYRGLQEWIGGRTLVDKTPTYAWSLETLKRAEAGFAQTRYVHLLRHPYATIASFEEARIEQVFFPRAEGFTRRQLAEMSWLLAQRNILEFLAAIPAGRRHVVRFEELVAEPERVLRELCGFLGLAYHEDMADPYKDRSVRMTDGLHAESRMLGDVKFHQHSGVDAKAGERWRELAAEGFLGAETRRLAARLGYEVEMEREAWTAIARVATEGPLPLSFAQERLWFLDRLEPGRSTYNLVNALRLAGRLETAALRGALAAVVRRHGALRTTFAETAGTAVQIVGPAFVPPLPQVDLTALPAARREAEARRRIEAEADRPFDLERGPLVRALLLRLAAEDHAVSLSLHHVVSDGWSMGVLVAEVAALYAAFVQGQPSPLPELPIQYGDFAVWQRRRLDGAALAGQLAWWRESLRDVPPLDLPADHARPPVQTFRGAHVPVALPADLSPALAALGAGERATMFMTLLAGFAVLLHRYSGQSDFAVGTPHANRDRSEVEGLIGFFVNTLALRVSTGGEPGFRELLGRVRETALGAFAHREVPFEKVVEELRPERDLARSPLFQAMLILQNNVSGPLVLPALTIAPYAFETASAKLELTLSLFEGPEGLVGSFEYNTDLYDAATVARMAAHFGRLLASAAAAPEMPAGELPMLADAERRELLTAWNDTARPREAGLRVHELFERQARRTPGAVAVAQGGAALTYGELDERSNRLARRLVRLGVGPEARVALCVERTPEMVVALLGILKAGGAYVPLDPSHPAERLGMVIEDSAPAVLVTEEGLLGALPPHSVPVLCLDRDGGTAAETAAESAAPLERPGDGESLAYVIYTSGSTGRPKGVQLPHRAVVNFLLAMAESPGLAARDVVPALTTLSFDIAGLEIHLPLAVGARIEMMTREEAADGRLLAARLAARGATLVQATPATWRLLLGSGWQALPGLRVLCGGEALPRDLAEALLARGVELWNVYGPTETAVWSAAGKVASGDGPVLLGEPIANTRFYVADRALQPAPVGVPGELWIAGDGLARGYLDRPDLTAERFAPDPFAAEPGARLYRTGDLVRYRLGGALEFLGRIDTQVKVRGYRIELGEIEAALLRHPSVGSAVVLVREEGGEKRLVAYVVPGSESSTAGEQRERLKLLLPDYMVPSSFVTLAAFPLTPSGKVDRKALPAPETSSAASTYLAPAGPVEELVAGIWAEVLRVERVGVNDNFFDLGGHSLLATQVISRLRVAVGVELPLQRLFERPTVRALTHALEAARREGMGVWLPPITAAPRRESPLPLSFAQERMWFLHQLDPGLTAYNLAQEMRLRGALNVPALERALSGVVRRHEALRTVFVAREDGPRQIVRPPAPVRLVRVDLRQVPAAARDEAIASVGRSMAERPFDLVAGPLFEVALLQLAADDAVLVVLMHHIVSDGWSIRLMISELAALYAADVGGLPIPLPELAIQYADFAVWQRRWLTDEKLAGDLGYWRAQLDGAPPLLELPTDRPRPALQTSRGARRRFQVAAATARQATAISRSLGLTPFMTLLAAFEAVFWRYTSAGDLVLGVPIANRNRAEIEGLIGTFVNMLVLRTRIPAETPDFAALAAQVRDVALSGFAHQDLPFEKLVDELRPERSLSYSPLFQVMFNLQNQPVATLELPGLTFTPHSTVRTQAQTDLTLAIGEATDGEGLEAFFEFNTDLFDAITMDRMGAHFVTLLAAAVAAPQRSIAELPLLGPGELLQVVTEWSDTAWAQPRGLMIHELFARRAAAAPAAPAVSCGAEVLSYGELDARSSRLANHLRSLGAGPEVRVALCLERTPAMVVALLGVLKAGAAYVPLDPGHPAERIRLVLADAGPAVLVTEERWLAGLPPHAARIVCLDRDAPAIAAASASPPPSTAGDESLAYVIYTSGSTGRPKGVQLPHRAVVSFLLAMAGRPGLTAADVVPAVTTLTFDIAGLEIYLPLAVGGRVEIVPREEAADGVRLAARLAEAGVTVLQATPATWRLLLDSGWAGSPTLKALCGGEALPRELADALLDRVGELWNVYGPTETAVWSAAGRVIPGAGAVLLGEPIANTRFAVVDRDFSPVPLGVPGELWIAGDGVARGYLGRPDLTAEKFTPDPFAAEPGARLYRTGDSVRWRPTGELEFLGRIDHQVKVRGYRIEPGEIEAALLRHPAVTAAVVVVREDGGEKRLVGYTTGDGRSGPPADELRRHLRELLPEYMVPAAYVALEVFPLTPSGKVDRKALPPPEGARAAATAVAYVPPRNELERTIAAVWRDVLKVDKVGVEDNFFDLGGHSLLLAQVHSRLAPTLGEELALLDLFRYPTVGSLAGRFSLQAGEVPANQAGLSRAVARREAVRTDGAVAIIGMSGRFPGAGGVEELWENLKGGVDSITSFSREELLEIGVPEAAIADPDYVPARGVIAGGSEFDAPFFGYSPREAELIDPQQRLFLECCWEALEGAGYEPARFPGDVGVFAGAGMNTYILNLLADIDALDALGNFNLMIGNDKDFLAPRVSYKLGLKGPSISVQTACSTSLVAVHLACQSLLSGECDAALAGGVSVRFPQEVGYRWQEGMVLSRDGRCRTFDAKASGFVAGNGAGVVVLRRLADALRDGDPIRAVIRGSAVNNDGSFKVGFTAPSVEGQAQVIAQALAMAGVEPGDIDYVEAHGTGTEMGDPIEVAALAQALGPQVPRGGCLIGSVKTNIGHLDTAAGVAGLIKAVLVLQHHQVPPSLNFEQPNPKLRLEESPFRVVTRLTEWEDSPEPRRAGVSSLGIGGTNAHVVLEEAPAVAAGAPGRPWQLLLLSARSEPALARAVAGLGRHFRRHPEVGIADAAYTLQVGRRKFDRRAVALCRDAADASAVLDGADADRLLFGGGEAGSVAFLFSGQGSQHPGMGADLYRAEPTFRDEVDRACEILRPVLGLDLRTLLFPAPAEAAEAAVRLAGTELTQPALFVIEHALARQWMAWGIRPAAMIGHSIGEYVAATVAGVFSLADALAVVAERGRLMAAMEPGAMLTISLPAAEVSPLLEPEVSVAAVNGPARTVVAGPEAMIARLETVLTARGAGHRRLRTSHAFHSAMMEPALAPFAERLARVTLAPPSLPFVSNVTGTWITAAEATDPAYWTGHLRATVRFAGGLAELLREPDRVLLEVGPGNALTTLAREAGATAFASLPHPNDRRSDLPFLLSTLGRLWTAGIEVDWQATHAGERRLRVPLPTYPFERQSYWLGGRGPRVRGEQAAIPAPVAAAQTYARPEMRTAYVAPSGGTEEALAWIWGELLGLDRVGAHDNFFDLGGHSLLATQMGSQIRSVLGIELPLQSIFDAPTVASLAREISAARQSSAGPALPPLVPLPRAGSLPLSFSQERMWFLHQLDPGGSAYNLLQAVRLSGALDVAALARCFAELRGRHESLRTAFRVEDGRPVQVVMPPASSLPLIDLAGLPAAARDGESRRLATGHQALPFDLSHGSLLRTALLRLGAGEHALLVTMHHIVSDGWSFGVLVRDVAALYRAFTAGEPSPLPELPLQYPDFALWQRQALAGETLEAETAWWRRRLAGEPPALRLPADRRRAEAHGFQVAGESLELPAELVSALRQLSRRQSASLYMTLLAAWKVLLARLTAEEDVLVGAPIANRNRAEVEGLIGFFLNTLLLRDDLAGNPSFGELLERVRESTLGAFSHQDLPLEMVLQAAHPERDPARTSPFQIMFLLQNLPVRELAVAGLTFSVLEAEQRIADLGTAIFEAGLTLVERPDDGGVLASLTYNGLLFDPASMSRLLARFERLLAAAAADPDRRLWSYDLLGEGERREILAWGAASPAPAGPFEPVHRAFERRAAAAPEALAVVAAGTAAGMAGERRLTYGELDSRSNRLAHRLRALGVGLETAVGVAVERSPEMLVALFGVLKAGGVAVPLDPSYPPERRGYILEDAGARVVLTAEAVAGACAGDGPDGPLEIEVGAENLAYLIYTSGSTGRPKGVMVRHGALAGYVAAFRDEHRLGPEDRVLQFASVSFDTSAEEIYPCLTSGAALVLRDDAMLASTPDFLRLCGEHRVSVLDLPTAFWHEMVSRLAEEPAALPETLRLIVLGGERALPERLAAWHRLGGGIGAGAVRVVNTYGPTETTIVATRRELPASLAIRGEVPIGRPVAGARAYVADPFLELAPAGVAGELCVGGSGLARGYLGRPDLTAERFVPDPWAAEPGARLYRTGDLVRLLPTDDLEFLGRVDDQVKIRGFRVELREVEAALALHPAVAEAVVAAREDVPGDRRLAAYVVPRDAAAQPSTAELRAFLKERLPDYMIPAAFVALEALPLTPSGKVDRRALPAPGGAQAEREGDFVAPRTAAEETVAAIWGEVLGVDRVGATDNFFELGGHSLLLPQVMHRLRSAFQIEIPLRTLFDEPSVESLALALEEILLADLERQLAETEALEGEESLAG